jgi:SNF2 family DNA or RNA helicase
METMSETNAMANYEWPRPHGFEPFNHQKVTAEFLLKNRKAFIFNEQGTGKTASVIWAVDYLMQRSLVKRVLVICPLSIMKSAWQQDLFKFALHRTVAVAHGSRTKRKEIINAGAEFVIINFDGVEIVKDDIINGGFDLIVVDEASAYKNAQTTRWKTLRDIHKVVKGLWMLTGTPAAQSPLDAYGLAKLINPKGVPMFHGQYRDMVMHQITKFKWIPKPTAKNTVHSILQPAIRFEKKQCLDLPPLTFVDREAPLTPQQSKYYAILKKEMLLEAAGEEVSAVNAATKMSKLLQISCGSVYTDNHEVLEFDVSNRMNVVQEVIDECSNKVLVFVPFTHTIEMLLKHLTKNGIACDVINGAVPVNRRSQIVTDFQTQPTTKVLIIQPQAASHGLTLTAADTIIWYAPCTSVETYLQANARIDRPGQVNPMTIVHICGSQTERRVYSMLRGNVTNHQQIIDLYRQEISSDDT